MSVVKSALSAVRRLPRGYSADGRSLGLGLAAALDAQRARGAEPVDHRAATPATQVTGGNDRRAKVG